MSVSNLPPGENQDEIKNHEVGNQSQEGENDDLGHEEDDPDDEFLEGFDPEGDFVDEDDDVVTLKKEDYEKLTKSINRSKTNIKQKKYFRTKYFDASGGKSKSSKQNSMNTPSNISEQKPATTTPSTPPVNEAPATTSPQNQPSDLENKVDVISLTTSYSYIDKETADEIVARAKKLGVSIEEVMSDKFFKPYLEAKKKDYEINHASLHNSTTTTTSINTGEEIDWKTASREQVEKQLQKISRGSRH